MTTNINISNKPVMAEQAKPVLKAVTQPLNNTKEQQNSVKSINSAEAAKEVVANKTDKAKKSSEQALDNAVEQINTYVQSISRDLEINYDKKSGESVVKVIDSSTKKVIRQIPDEEALEIAEKLRDDLNRNSGLLIDKIQA
jgi:uncharacterized FlaG/YvyC family protein